MAVRNEKFGNVSLFVIKFDMDHPVISEPFSKCLKEEKFQLGKHFSRVGDLTFPPKVLNITKLGMFLFTFLIISEFCLSYQR